MKNTSLFRKTCVPGKVVSTVRYAFTLAVGSLAFGILFVGTSFSKDQNPPPGWEPLRSVEMSGGLRAFWDISGAISHQAEAHGHGFSPVLLLSDYSDYPGKQKRNIFSFLQRQHPANNPWHRPDYFEEILRQNIGLQKKVRDARTSEASIFVHDIEFEFEQDIAKAWADPVVRKASGATTLDEFEKAYLAKWAEWFWLPCTWGKEVFPHLQTGLYGPQPFRRDFWGISGKDAKQIDGTHTLDGKLWKYIDPHVDFYVASIYLFYDTPGSLYYIASNVEENVNRTRQYGNKPVYAYSWLRYHNSNKMIGTQELASWHADAIAVIPYFYGAKGNVLWGWEPKSQDKVIYENLPIYVESLGRIADLSEKIANAEPAVDDELAHVLWKEKRPLLRRLKVNGNEYEWIVLAANPWQNEKEKSTLDITCGNRKVSLELQGRHCDIFHITKDHVERLQVDYSKAQIENLKQPPN